MVNEGNLTFLSTELGMVLGMLRWKGVWGQQRQVLGDGGWAPSLWLLEDRLLFAEVLAR